ncbi:MAG: hypothetical protein QOD03_38 [Verrucomicrobiota bacterium]|jgi:hypothetical protein
MAKLLRLVCDTAAVRHHGLTSARFLSSLTGMKSPELIKPLAISFVIALLLYLVFYNGIEHRRTRKGPWQVSFTNNASGAPAILINQPTLAITNVEIVFPAETAGTNSMASIDWAQPRPVPFEVPFGKCVFMDTTFLPGSLVFEIFGHEIQLIPRMLTIDKKEQPWRSNTTVPITNSNALNHATN